MSVTGICRAVDTAVIRSIRYENATSADTETRIGLKSHDNLYNISSYYGG